MPVRIELATDPHRQTQTLFVYLTKVVVDTTVPCVYDMSKVYTKRVCSKWPKW